MTTGVLLEFLIEISLKNSEDKERIVETLQGFLTWPFAMSEKYPENKIKIAENRTSVLHVFETLHICVAGWGGIITYMLRCCYVLLHRTTYVMLRCCCALLHRTTYVVLRCCYVLTSTRAICREEASQQ